MPLRIAIVGSGPAGFYAAEALFRQSEVPVEVDMFDRLPTPYGLVRGGVAPDHQKIKAVTRVFASTAARPLFRFLGNVQLGRDLAVEDLRRHYHQIVYATGNEADRRLGIPGEGMRRCSPATVFVGWYNGHPDYRRATFDLSVERVAVVGNGNVALDVARLLLRSRAELARTDVAAHALEVLCASRVREVFLIGRRGPAQAAFSPAQLEELGEMEEADPVVDPRDLEVPVLPRRSPNVEVLRALAARPQRPGAKKLHLRFLASPTDVVADGEGAVAGLGLERNRLEERPDGTTLARGTGEREVLPVGMVLPAVGYAGAPISGVPHDERTRTIANDDGRVVDARHRTVVPGEYVVGWARSGPQGLIGEHKRASAHVASHVLLDAARCGLAARELPAREAIEALLREERGVRAVSFLDWRQLDEVEVERGTRRGAPRDKLVEVEEMLRVLGDAALAAKT